MLNVNLNNPLEIRAVGLQALRDALGPVGMVRFIQQYDMGYGDYAKKKAKEQIRQIISENNLTSVTDVHALLRDSFKDILQELMEAELDARLGYEKNNKGDLQTDNKRNGHSSKNLKSQYGKFQIN